MKRNSPASIAIAVAAGGAVLLARNALRRNRKIDLRNRIVLITGGSRGLGLVLARQFADEGAKLAICARDEEELGVAHRELTQYGASVLAIPADLTVEDDARRVVTRVLDHYGCIDVLVNNAGIIGVGPIEHITMEDYRFAMESNFWSAVNLAFHAVPHMQARRSGRIVNITSIGGKLGVPHLTPYCASKFALVGWSRAIRAELAKDGVVVTTICPGLMRTGSPRHADFKGQNEKEYAWFKIADSIPGLSVSAEHAASEILQATRSGEAERIIGVVAKFGVLFDHLLPELSSEVLSIAGRFLPGPGGIGEQSRKGAESESSASRNPITTLTEKAALRNNEVPA
ncbi:MAG: SDR family NAD(P)-dependent oxidoreductase [Bryobacteraceae bacterium]|nr:SDR family NAD(P)-dependent oxidoreductase [Bryobacteraceae bacterium]